MKPDPVKLLHTIVPAKARSEPILCRLVDPAGKYNSDTGRFEETIICCLLDDDANIVIPPRGACELELGPNLFLQITVSEWGNVILRNSKSTIEELLGNKE